MKKFIPNAITLCNLLCGVIAVLFAAHYNFGLAGLFVLLGIFFDFFDGLAARLLKVPSELGKQLDSLADLVTSGIAPAVILFGLLQDSWVCFLALLMPLFAAYRLAKFNLDERQHTSFRGLPAPANALFWVPFGLYYWFQDWALVDAGDLFIPVLCTAPIVFGIVTLLLDVAMVCDLPMMSLKFKSFAWKELRPKVIFLAGCLILIVLFGLMGVSFSILYYILFSLIVRPKHD